MPFHINEERIDSSLNTTGDTDFFSTWKIIQLDPYLTAWMEKSVSEGIIVSSQPEPTRQAVCALCVRAGEVRLTKHLRAQKIANESRHLTLSFLHC